MAPFSMLKKSPRGRRKGSEQQNSGDDVKISSGTSLREDDQPDTSPDDIESKESGNGNGNGDGETKGRRGFNKDLLHNLRSRLTGKPPSSTPQRGTAQQEAATVSTSMPSAHSRLPSQVLHRNLLWKFNATASMQ
jgi:hypothetical protein